MLTSACAMFVANAQETAEPNELTNVKAAYKDQLKTATESIVKNHLQNLDELNKKLQAKGDAAGATAVQKEIASLSANNSTVVVQATSGAIEGGASANPADEDKSANLVKIWNTHNGPWKNKGADKVKVEIFKGNNLVFESDELEIEWKEDACPSLDVKFPENLNFDRVRVNITKVHNHGGGLADVQVIVKGKNISKGCTTAASSVYKTYKSTGCLSSNAVDGITKDAGDGEGYWLLGSTDKSGWIDLNVKVE